MPAEACWDLQGLRTVKVTWNMITSIVASLTCYWFQIKGSGTIAWHPPDRIDTVGHGCALLASNSLAGSDSVHIVLCNVLEESCCWNRVLTTYSGRSVISQTRAAIAPK